MRHFFKGYSFLALVFFIPALAGAQGSADQFDALIDRYATESAVDRNLIKSVIQVASQGNPQAISASGDKGLIPMSQDLAKSLGVENPADPEQNIKAGCRYFKKLLTQFGNKNDLALAAFNAGPQMVEKYGGVPPFAETKNFVNAVLKTYEDLQKPSTASQVFGNWVGTGSFTRYTSTLPAPGIIGKSIPFDLVITPLGSGVSIKNTQGVLGDPALYQTKLAENTLHVDYSGPNTQAVSVPNTISKHTMTYSLDLAAVDGGLKGEITIATVADQKFTVPGANLPDVHVETTQTLALDLKRKP